MAAASPDLYAIAWDVSTETSGGPEILTGATCRAL